jgi:hypothetical protein
LLFTHSWRTLSSQFMLSPPAGGSKQHTLLTFVGFASLHYVFCYAFDHTLEHPELVEGPGSKTPDHRIAVFYFTLTTNSTATVAIVPLMP